MEQNVQNSIASIEAYIGQLIGNVYGVVSGFIGGIAALVLVFVLAFYMVAEEREGVRFFKNIIPDEYQEFAANLMYEVERKFSRWLVGQVVLCFIIGLCYFVGLSIIGVDGALVLGILAGFFEIVPYLGPILGGIVIVLVAFTQAPILAVFAAILMMVIQWLENNLLVPKVMQKAVGLNPVLSIVALLVGAKIFGFVGMILSIPVTTGVSVALTEYFKYRKEKKK
jgi:predicted PurR-regulated permease PerM